MNQQEIEAQERKLGNIARALRGQCAAIHELLDLFPSQPGVHTDEGVVFGYRTKKDKEMADALNLCVDFLEKVQKETLKIRAMIEN